MKPSHKNRKHQKNITREKLTQADITPIA